MKNWYPIEKLEEIFNDRKYAHLHRDFKDVPSDYLDEIFADKKHLSSVGAINNILVRLTGKNRSTPTCEMPITKLYFIADISYNNINYKEPILTFEMRNGLYEKVYPLTKTYFKDYVIEWQFIEDLEL